MVGAGCATGIIYLEDEEDQTSDCNEPGGEGESNTVKQEVEECIKKCYRILKLAEGANEEAIRKAFRKLSGEHHPDKGGKDEDFQEINNVHAALLEYCRYLSDNSLEHGASNIDFRKHRENKDIKQILDYY